MSPTWVPHESTHESHMSPTWVRSENRTHDHDLRGERRLLWRLRHRSPYLLCHPVWQTALGTMSYCVTSFTLRSYTCLTAIYVYPCTKSTHGFLRSETNVLCSEGNRKIIFSDIRTSWHARKGAKKFLRWTLKQNESYVSIFQTPIFKLIIHELQRKWSLQSLSWCQRAYMFHSWLGRT
jgi:hypothetical protein